MLGFDGTLVAGPSWLSHLPSLTLLLAPACLVIGSAASTIPLPSYLKNEGELPRVPVYLRRPVNPLRRWTLLLVCLSESIGWAVVCGWRASIIGTQAQWWINLLGSLGHSIVWAYLSYKLPVNSVAPTSYLWLAPLLVLRPALVLLEAGHTAYSNQASMLQLLPIDRLIPTVADLAAAGLVLLLVLGMRVDEREVIIQEDEINGETIDGVSPSKVDEKIHAYWKKRGYASASPETDATVWRSWTYNWILPLMKYGYSHDLTSEDIPALPKAMRSRPVYETWTRLNADGRTRSLTQKIIRANARDVVIMILAAWAEVGAMYVGPFCVKRILDGLTKATPEAMADAYLYTLIALVGAVAKAAFESIGGWHGRRAGCAVRAEIIANIYEKALKRSDFSGAATKDGEKQKDGEHATGADLGKIVQIMSNDSRKLAARVMNTDTAVAAPVQLVVAVVFLYNLMGWSALAGFIAVIIALPLNSYLANRSVVITKAVLAVRDKRMKTMNELILAIKHIKFFAWERQWTKRILDIFEDEMVEMRRNRINSVMFGLVWYFAPLGMNLVSFACYIFIAKKELDVATAFTAIALFNMLKMPLTAIPAQRVAFMQAYVSVKRIEAFLEEPECEDYVSSLKRDISKEEPEDAAPYRLGIENGTFVWAGTERPSETNDASNESDAGSSNGDQTGAFLLADIDIDFPIGKLTLITGPTGSGKTALLNALLGEMDCISGKVHLTKRAGRRDVDGLENTVAFAAQTPWLQYMTIRSNILFGNEYEQERYDKVIDCCCLGPDLAMFEDGDSTEIGIKGVTLSGGQKARVALARAVYSRAKHLIFDDVFAAVDVHVAKRLVDKCLKGPLLAGRTVVLVSHHAELLLRAAAVHHLIDMDRGRIRCSGTVDELMKSGDLPEILAEEEAELEKEIVDDEAATSSSLDEGTKVATPTSAGDDKVPPKHLFNKLVKEEERQYGSVRWSTYKLYLTAASWAIVFGVLIAQLLGELCSASSRFWLKIWGEAYPDRRQAFAGLQQRHFVAFDMQQVHLHGWIPNTGDVMNGNWPSALEHPSFYLGIFALISTIHVGVFTTAQQALMYTGTLRASRTLHFKLLHSVTRATFRWYDTNPAGRILNRFSSDLELITSGIGSTLRSVIIYMASIFTSVIMLSLVVSPYASILAVAVSVIYWRLGVYYVRTARECRRLLASSRSPLYTAFGEALDGIVTVRAFSAEQGLLTSMFNDVDFMHSQTYIWQMCNKWLLFNFDVLGAVIIFCITLMALQGSSAGSAGIAIVSVQSFVGCLFYISRDWTNVEQAFNSVERVEAYLSIPHESAAIEEHRRPPAGWPSNHGDVLLKVEDLSVRYAPELPDVLKGISFEVKPRERVGIVGRTGSGKSTLGMSLLRFCDPSGGRIVLDEIDITTIGVEDLRSRMTYIPQEACLFSGTIRSNLDPFSEHTDEELTDALIRAQLTTTTSSVPSRTHSRQVSRAPSFTNEDTRTTPPTPVDDEHLTAAPPTMDGLQSPKPTAVSLDSHVTAGGANWSHGQRQLISLARAIVRQSACVIMDEATSAVDTSTDAALQTAIAENFKNSCLITVAHRLNTIIGFDRVLVLDNGRVVEFDSPHQLLQRPSSAFKDMVAASGQEEELTRAAADAASRMNLRGPDKTVVGRVKRLG